MSLRHKERMRCALRHEPVDRIPTQLILPNLLVRKWDYFQYLHRFVVDNVIGNKDR